MLDRWVDVVILEPFNVDVGTQAIVVKTSHPHSSLQPRTTFSNQSIVSLAWFIALRMPYRDTPNDDDGDGGDGDDYPFARPATTKEKSNQVKEKKAAARERKRQLEDKIRSSMKTLKYPT